MRVAVCTDSAAWDDFVAGAGGSLLQSWQWGEFKRRQGWHVLRLVAAQGVEPRAALQILARGVAGLGGFFYAAEGPVLPPADWAGDTEPLVLLFAAARRYGRAYGALTLRVDPLVGDFAAVAALQRLGLRRSPANVQPAATAVVELAPSEDQLFANLEKGARYMVRNARRKGALVRPGAPADLAAFAAMVAETGRRKGFGTRDTAYLRDLAQMVTTHGLGDFMVAEIEGEPIGGILTGTFGPRSSALYAAGNPTGHKVGGQYLLHWEAMARAKGLGCLLYDFRGIGAADDPDDHWAGMTFFKKRFGTRREELPGAWDDVYRPVAYRAFLLAQQARRELPKRLHALRPINRNRAPSGHADGAEDRLPAETVS